MRLSSLNSECGAQVHGSRHVGEIWSHESGLHLCASLRTAFYEHRNWNSSSDSGCGDELPLLGYPCMALGFHPTKGNKATHEEDSFNEVNFVNHSTSQTWFLPENEQFCIKRSISVNGEGLTSFGCSVSPVKWNHQVGLGLGHHVSAPGGFTLH